MKRDIITIDEEKCNGCGNCVPGCPEGALQVIDGKARLVSDLYCDGLGACIGECPTGALTVEHREAERYDEKRTMHNIIAAGDNTIRAHLRHLLSHGEDELYQQACEALSEQGLDPEDYSTSAESTPVESAQAVESLVRVGSEQKSGHIRGSGGGCPGSRIRDFSGGAAGASSSAGAATEAGPRAPAKTSGAQREVSSKLRQWPVQLHLVSPRAPYFQKADILLAADCSAFAVGDFHSRYLEGKALATACPKLDSGQESYLQKLTALIDESRINTITVLMMEVPCCGGLLQLVRKAAAQAERKVPIKAVIVGLQGEELREEWV